MILSGGETHYYLGGYGGALSRSLTATVGANRMESHPNNNNS